MAADREQTRREMAREQEVKNFFGADREQTRRDAEDGNLIGWKVVLELLAELEQAEEWQRLAEGQTVAAEKRAEQAERERETLVAKSDGYKRERDSAVTALEHARTKLRDVVRERDEAREGENGFRSIATRYERALELLASPEKPPKSVEAGHVQAEVEAIAREALDGREQE